MKRIPFGGLKRVRLMSPQGGTRPRDNEENPLRGIETMPGFWAVWASAMVTMKRIPFGGLKLRLGEVG